MTLSNGTLSNSTRAKPRIRWLLLLALAPVSGLGLPAAAVGQTSKNPVAVVQPHATEVQTPAAPGGSIYDIDNLVAWCIVPFDAQHRTPAQRAQMLSRLGIRRVAYDWRDEHVPGFEEEVIQYRQHDLEFFAFWSWHDALEPLVRKYGIRPQIWTMMPQPAGDSQDERIAHAVRAIQPLVEKTRTLQLPLGLYNHGGWSGEPENLVAVCKALRSGHQATHVGIVYNFHHGHDHIARFDRALASMQPYLLCVNINGMIQPAQLTADTKILPIGQGEHEAAMMEVLQRSGYRGPIGILDHRPQLDAEQSLAENLQGLTRLRAAALCK